MSSSVPTTPPAPPPASGAGEPAAVVEDLDVSLVRDGVRSQVLRGVDLRIDRGEIFGLVGESGSGKSVLALTLLGLLPASSRPHVTGRVRVAGTDMVEGSAAQHRRLRREELGAIFQDPMTSLNPTMRVGRQVTEVTGDAGESVRLLTDVGIPDAKERARAYPHELSGGLRQRVMAAVAVAGRPSVVVADEPTTALDVTVQAQLLDLLREMRDSLGCSVLLITHDLAVARQVCNRMAVLYAGRVAELGRTQDVLHAPSHPYTVGLLRSRLSLHTPRHEHLPTLRPETEDEAERLRGCAYHTRCPLVVDRCRQEQPRLEQVEDDGRDERSGHGRHSAACWRPLEDVRALAAAPATSENRAGARTGHPGTGHRQAAVTVRDLHCTLGTRRRPVHVLRGIDLEVAPGEALSVVGESGSGKSTLLRVLAGLAPVSAGHVEVATGGTQMVFQDAGSSLTPWLTVGEVLRERLRSERLPAEAVRRRVEEALEDVGLAAGVARARPAQLSGGQRQRVALARATLVPPAVLLCDEPTSALDASLAANVLNLVRRMRAELGMSVVFVTHDLSVARLMGDRIAVMTQGELVEVGAVDDVVSAPAHPYTRSLLASVPDLEVPA